MSQVSGMQPRVMGGGVSELTHCINSCGARLLVCHNKPTRPPPNWAVSSSYCTLPSCTGHRQLRHNTPHPLQTQHSPPTHTCILSPTLAGPAAAARPHPPPAAHQSACEPIDCTPPAGDGHTPHTYTHMQGKAPTPQTRHSSRSAELKDSLRPTLTSVELHSLLPCPPIHSLLPLVWSHSHSQ